MKTIAKQTVIIVENGKTERKTHKARNVGDRLVWSKAAMEYALKVMNGTGTIIDEYTREDGTVVQFKYQYKDGMEITQNRIGY